MVRRRVTVVREFLWGEKGEVHGRKDRGSEGEMKVVGGREEVDGRKDGRVMGVKQVEEERDYREGEPAMMQGRGWGMT